MSEKIRLLPPFDINFMTMSISERKNYGLDMHNVPGAWLKTKGEGIRVAVIDTGLPVHRDLDSQVVASANFTDSPIKDLVVGHGSHCAGIICAIENDEGVVGIAPKAELIIAKALGDDGSGSDDSLAKAIDWCIEQGVHVINMSLGAPASAEPYFSKTKAAVKRAYAKNIVIVCASGNEYAKEVGVPAKWDECIAVGAVNDKKQKADFSNSGSTLDFAASGVNIVSTFKNNSYASLSGTSMAAPQIAGIVALILSEHRGDQTGRRTPVNGPLDVMEHLKNICIDLGESGFDKDYGFGLPVYGTIDDDFLELPVEPPVEQPVEPPKPKPRKMSWNQFVEWVRSLNPF